MFPEENEVLIQQGLPFQVEAVEEKQDSGEKYTEIVIKTSETKIAR